MPDYSALPRQVRHIGLLFLLLHKNSMAKYNNFLFALGNMYQFNSHHIKVGRRRKKSTAFMEWLSFTLIFRVLFRCSMMLFDVSGRSTPFHIHQGASWNNFRLTICHTMENPTNVQSYHSIPYIFLRVGRNHFPQSSICLMIGSKVFPLSVNEYSE